MKAGPLLILLIILLTDPVAAQVRLPHLISDGMVLQRDENLAVWGWAGAGEAVEVRIGDESYRTSANPDGRWSVTLNARPAGGPYAITVKGTNEITVRNVLFGDVWLCTGQSNMVHQMKLHRVRYADDIAQADFPEIRHFSIPSTPQLAGPAKELAGGEWKAATPENVLEFTAVGYFFARDIYEKHGVPIGLINASVGGTPIEAWTSEAGLQDFPDLTATIHQNKDTAYVNQVNRRARQFASEATPSDAGTAGPTPWYAETLVPGPNWRPINVPGYWEDQGLSNLNGTVWYHREVDLPAGMAGQEAEVFLGRIVDADELYINGRHIGSTGYQYPQRRYPVPAGLLRAGKNRFTVRVTNHGGKGGFVPDRPYQIHTASDTVDLKGTWQYRVGVVFPPPRSRSAPGISAQHQPTALFNGMLAPVTKYAIKGVLWYQGESNAGRPESYAALQAAQIADFRRQWDRPNLPFFFVQLPGFMDFTYLPAESNWAALREAQRQTLRIPHTGMAVAIDLGEWNDIHPDNKRDVGLRLARLARQQVYGEPLVASGPLPDRTEVRDGVVRLYFTDSGGELMSSDGEPLREFALAGYDGTFHWAEAKIVGDHLEVSHPDIPYPRTLRYAWSDNPRVNLYNRQGLPAAPFEMVVGAPAPPRWHGKQAAVVLTYDDALEVHLDHALPALDERGLRGTFYLTAAAPASQNRLEDWRRAAANGHELGNHTLYHPCDATLPGREWVQPERDLSRYTTADIVAEVRMTNTFLHAVDGKSERTFAYTCGDTQTSDGSFIGAIADDFAALRGVRGRLSTIDNVNLQNVDTYVVDGHSAEDMIGWVKQAERENALLVILFHGVGGGHGLNVSLDAHRELLDYLSHNADTLWVATMLEVAQHVKAFRP
ncbi:sialate O-acetylesterase [Lewinella aquimaris]|uniref:Sialate O-acetylesterase n=1 Tax=Neolewinella aquimaris TaxID=1835722 RepID=A0A840E781_9BACT|nr:sialate O-acetylesterase [Neolewinella aquimaris]MBB4079592.1 sialate O-acetylesterase [Neolewinella aquimaris]